jgi:hypothetical protein
MEIEMGAIDPNDDSDIDLRLPDGASEDFEISERQIMQIPASNNRDTSMISASGASSA